MKVVETLAPRRSRLKESWLIFKRNSLAFAGLIIFVLFFCAALMGLILTSGDRPLLDPAMTRLQEKLLPPLSVPNQEILRTEEIPKLGIYLFGTDNLGRDLFARMLQGAWVSLTVGFVAVGIAVIIGIFMGGIAGYFGRNHIRLDHILVFFFLVSGGSWPGSIFPSLSCLRNSLSSLVFSSTQRGSPIYSC